MSWLYFALIGVVALTSFTTVQVYKELIEPEVIEIEVIKEVIRYEIATDEIDLELLKAQWEEDYNGELASCYNAINDCNKQTQRSVVSLEEASKKIKLLSIDLVNCYRN